MKNRAPLASLDELKAAYGASTVPDANVALETFRDFHMWLSGIRDASWLVVFRGTETTVQLIGMPAISIVVKPAGGRANRFFWKSDFTFLDEGSKLFGSWNGRYSLLQFTQEVLSWRRVVALTLFWIVFGWLDYHHFTAEVIVSLGSALVAALSIFITMFTTITLNLNPETDFRYLETGRLRDLAETDKYIAAFSAIVLAACIAAAVLGSIKPCAPMLRPSTWVCILQAVFLGFGTAGAGLAFWLVISYHFTRKYAMCEIAMTTLLLREQQAAREYAHSVFPKDDRGVV